MPVGRVIDAEIKGIGVSRCVGRLTQVPRKKQKAAKAAFKVGMFQVPGRNETTLTESAGSGCDSNNTSRRKESAKRQEKAPLGGSERGKGVPKLGLNPVVNLSLT
jgi:hypothetical protein